MYYTIDERLAKQAQTVNSFYEYKPGSATAEYQAAVDSAAALAEAQKKKVSPYYYQRIEQLLDSYSRRLAEWTNAENRNRASCPSIMISGGSNFPMGKKNKQNAREETLMREYDEIQGILHKIKAIGTGGVDLADPHARELLQDKLDRLLEEQRIEKKLNAWHRKRGTCVGCPDVPEEMAQRVQKAYDEIRFRAPYVTKPFPDYELASIRDKIKRVRERLDQLDKMQAIPADEKTITFEGGEIVRNVDLNRLQIIFEEKPNLEVREAMKANGFRWSPRQNAWQRQLTDNAMVAAKAALGI